MNLPKKYKPIAKRCGMTQERFLEVALNHFVNTAAPYYEARERYKRFSAPIKIKKVRLPSESQMSKEERLAYQREYYRKNKERILKERTRK